MQQLPIVNDSSSVMVKAKINSEVVNSLLDTGADVSLLDTFGTLEKSVDSPKLTNTEKTLMDSSGKIMDICGELTLHVELVGVNKDFQNFFILNWHTSRNIILGRDYMKTLGNK